MKQETIERVNEINKEIYNLDEIIYIIGKRKVTLVGAANLFFVEDKDETSIPDSMKSAFRECCMKRKEELKRELEKL